MGTPRTVTLTLGGLPTLSVRVISSEPYSFPPNAKTPPGFCTGSLCTNGAGAPTTGVVTNDADQLREAQYINGVLVAALDTGVTIPGETAERSGVAWFVVRPSVAGGHLPDRATFPRLGPQEVARSAATVGSEEPGGLA